MQTMTAQIPRKWNRQPAEPAHTLAAIRLYSRQIATEFNPEKIILFGSYAYGCAGPDSDVDLLIIAPTRNPNRLAVAIRCKLPAPFPLDLLVRTQESFDKRVELGDPFLGEIAARGVILHESDHSRMGAEGRGGSAERHKLTRPASTAP